MDFEETLRQDQRLVILRLLAEVDDHALNEVVIEKGLAHWGHNVSRDKVRDHLRFLAEMGAVAVQEIGVTSGGVHSHDARLLLARLRARGLDHVERRTRVEGVARPGLR